MVISAYLSLLDDWDILQPALNSVIDRVDEIIVIDGAYQWMVPYFSKAGRDPAYSLPQVYDTLQTLGPKIRVINGVWGNEMEKRVAGFAACQGRYRYRVDADEIFFFDESHLKNFFASPYAVGQMEMPTYIVPGVISGAVGTSLPRQSFLFDSDKISAFEHLSYLWLVLPEWERAKCGEPRPELIYPDSLAFNAHLTHWRPPTSSLARARFYVMNYMRQHGGPAFAGYPPGTGIVDFTAYFDKLPPAAFDEMLLGRAMVVLPAADQFTGRQTPLAPAQEQSFVHLHDAFLASLAALNAKLLTGWRTMARGEQHFLDATLPTSLPAGPDNILAFEFATAPGAVKMELATHGTPAMASTTPLDVRIVGSYAITQLPPLPAPGTFLRRTLALSVWPQDGAQVTGFRLLSVQRQAPLADPPPTAIEALRNAAQTAEAWSRTARHPDATAADFLHAGEAFLEQRDFDSASAILAEGVAKFPEDIWLGRLWTLAAKGADDPAEAARRLAQIRHHADADFLAADHADCLVDAGRIAEAETVLVDALQKFPESRWVNLSWVRIPARSADLAELTARWQVVDDRIPPADAADTQMLYEKTNMLLHAGAFAAARPAFERLEALQAPADFALGPWIVGWPILRDPLTIVAAVYSFEAVVRPIMEFRTGIPGPVFFFFGSNMSLVFHHELRAKLPAEFHALSAEFPNAQITFMTNEIAELRLARRLGMNAVLVNNNAFVDTSIYDIQPAVPKIYDAVNNARFMPYKRPELAADVASLRLIMAGPKTAEWNGVELNARTMFPRAELNDAELDASGVVAALNSAHVGLCLSANEGAMYAAIEYMLCGLPIVTTRNVGGRDWWFSDDTAMWCDATPQAVAAAVQTMRQRQIDPQHVRLTALERIRRERLHFYDVVRRKLSAHGFPHIDIEAACERLFSDKANYHAHHFSHFVKRGLTQSHPMQAKSQFQGQPS